MVVLQRYPVPFWTKQKGLLCSVPNLSIEERIAKDRTYGTDVGHVMGNETNKGLIYYRLQKLCYIEEDWVQRRL